MTIREIPLNKLFLSPRNMRQGETLDPVTGEGAVPINDLLASFRARRTGKQTIVLQNLNVTEEKGEDGKSTGRFAVHVGGRRWRALSYMAQLKELPKTFNVPCMVCATEAQALEESVEENYLKLDPHPAQRFKAFKSMSDEGRSNVEIAERFDTSELIVARRLKLAAVSPRIFELFEQNKVDLNQMEALTLSDDHAAQERAFFDFPNRHAHDLRRRLVEGEKQTRDYSLFRLVGAEAYTAAGGFIRQDLFSDEGHGYVADHALVEKLALERLEAEAAPIRLEGWKWVETLPAMSYQDKEKFGRVYPQTLPLSDEALAQIAEVEAELEALSNADDEDEEASARFLELEGELSKLQEAGEDYTAEQMALAGVVVTVAYNGAITIERGLVRPEDNKAMKAMAREAAINGEEIETKVGAGQNRRADGLPAALVEELTARRSLAISSQLMDNPLVALVALVHRLALITFYKRDSFGGVLSSAIVIDGGTHNHSVYKHGEGLDETEASKALEARKAAILATLPGQPEGLWDYLVTADPAHLMEIMAYCTARQVYTVDLGTAADQRRRNSHEIAGALGLDMADFWSPTASFFKRIPKEEISRAMSEGAGVEETPELAKAKKGELAERAERALDGKRWVPEILRTPPLAKADITPKALAVDVAEDDLDVDEGEDDDGSEFEDLVDEQLNAA